MRHIGAYRLMMNTAVFLKTTYLSGTLTLNTCFPEFYPVCAVLSTIDQFISNCKLIFVSGRLNISVHPISLLFLWVEFCVIDLIVCRICEDVCVNFLFGDDHNLTCLKTVFLMYKVIIYCYFNTFYILINLST